MVEFGKFRNIHRAVENKRKIDGGFLQEIFPREILRKQEWVCTRKNRGK